MRIIIMEPLGLKMEQNMITLFTCKKRKIGEVDEYVEDQAIGYYGTIADALIGFNKYAVRMELVECPDHIKSIEALMNKINTVEHNILKAVEKLKIEQQQ